MDRINKELSVLMRLRNFMNYISLCKGQGVCPFKSIYEEYSSSAFIRKRIYLIKTAIDFCSLEWDYVDIFGGVFLIREICKPLKMW